MPAGSQIKPGAANCWKPDGFRAVRRGEPPGKRLSQRHYFATLQTAAFLQRVGMNVPDGSGIYWKPSQNLDTSFPRFRLE
jgi:hypothetical protein